MVLVMEKWEYGTGMGEGEGREGVRERIQVRGMEEQLNLRAI